MTESTVQYELPMHWASYLINGDATGLEDHEKEVVDAWLKSESYPYFVDVSEPYFRWRNDATKLGGDVCTYTAFIDAP